MRSSADAELLKDRMFGGINLTCDPELTRQKEMATWQRKTTLGPVYIDRD